MMSQKEKSQTKITPMEYHSANLEKSVRFKQSQLGDHLFYYFVVAITGAAIMMIELMGTRILGPFYGVSLFVWTSLISVTLLALAIGYYSGGLLADERGTIKLSHIIFVAAVFTGIIPIISAHVLASTDVLGLRVGALVSALILFTIPLALLGMAGPFIIKMSTSTLSGIGSAVGSIYAVSTLGSVAGTLLLGFYLLPLFGTRIIVLAVSLILIVLAICLAIFESKRLYYPVSSGLWVVSSVTAVLILGVTSQLDGRSTVKGYKVLSEAESHYGWVRVVDQPKEGLRWLLSDSSTIGVSSLDTGNGLLKYQQIVAEVPRFLSKPENALLIGLGSGHLVKVLDKKGIKTDTLEIDPEVAKAAKQHFNFKPTGDLIIGDARYQITRLEKQYDLIIHDCFTGGTEPIHLLSLEMLQSMKKRLKDNGIMVLNMVGFLNGPNRHAVESVARTLDEVFAFKRVFVSEPDTSFNDFIFLVSDEPLELEKNKNNKRVASWLKNKETSIKTDDAIIITDDYNPLESMQVSKAEQYRSLFVQRMGKEILLR